MQKACINWNEMFNKFRQLVMGYTIYYILFVITIFSTLS